MSRRPLLASVLLLAILAPACGVRPSAVITGNPAPAAPTEGATLYFLTNSSLMRVRRPTPQHLSPTQTLALLQAGPDPEEQAVNLTSEVPTTLNPTTVTIDASGKIDIAVSTDVKTLSPTAIDQIVCTLSDTLTTTAPITLTSNTTTRGPQTCPLTG
jgi:hypothetical protein